MTSSLSLAFPFFFDRQKYILVRQKGSEIICHYCILIRVVGFFRSPGWDVMSLDGRVYGDGLAYRGGGGVKRERRDDDRTWGYNKLYLYPV